MDPEIALTIQMHFESSIKQNSGSSWVIHMRLILSLTGYVTGGEHLSGRNRGTLRRRKYLSAGSALRE